MSFPILRADLNDPKSAKLDLSSVTVSPTMPFIERRVINLSKAIVDRAKHGGKRSAITITNTDNLALVVAGLKVNFPDVDITDDGKHLITVVWDATPGFKGSDGAPSS
jgi:hypothetical protein